MIIKINVIKITIKMLMKMIIMIIKIIITQYITQNLKCIKLEKKEVFYINIVILSN